MDIVTYGDILIDLTPSGKSESDNPLFECNAGGDVGNFIAACARFGCKTAILAMVGKDGFGSFLKHKLSSCGVNTEGLITTDKAPTTLACVSLDENGERSFSFYRDPGADTLYSPEDLREEVITGAKLVHLSALSMTNEPSKSTTLRVIELAKQHHVKLSYDPNWRESLWKHDSEPIKTIKAVLKEIDILKLSDEEAGLFFNGLSYEQAADEAIKLGVALVVVTLGANGCYYRHKSGYNGSVPGFKMAAVDTTGAGDIFWGALMSRLYNENLDTLRQDVLEGYLVFANAAAALSTLKKGGISSIPAPESVMELVGKTEFHQ